MAGFLEQDWTRIHRDTTFRPVTPLLALCSAGYGVGVRLRLWGFRSGLFRRHRAPGPVISVGNVTVGGTGKTPFVIMLAEWCRRTGYRPAVLSRGYGGRHGDKVMEVSDGQGIKADAGACGDEPWLLANALDGVPVIVSKKRVLAARYAGERFGCDLFILDDGFQHMELERDVDVVLVDAAHPFGNGRLLPWGPLREPVRRIRRADACVITRCGKETAAEKTHRLLAGMFPSKPVFRSDHVPYGLCFPRTGKVHAPGFLKGRRVAAFAGIADPDAFRESLEGLGADVVCFRGFRDHHRYRAGEIRDLLREMKARGGEYLLTTEKDWPRVSRFVTDLSCAGYLSIRLELVSGRDAFFTMVRKRIERAAGAPGPGSVESVL